MSNRRRRESGTKNERYSEYHRERERERQADSESQRLTVARCGVRRIRIAWCFVLDGQILGFGFSSYSSLVAMAPASALRDVWMKSKRIRQRFAKNHPFVQFPAVEEGKLENNMSTLALAMNSRTLLGMVKHYRVLSGKKVPIVNLQKAVPCQIKGV